MAPLSKEIRPISSRSPPHLGPAVPEVNTPWFKLYLYHLTGAGPPTLLIPQVSNKIIISSLIKQRSQDLKRT